MRKGQLLADIFDGVEIVEDQCEETERREEQRKQDRARPGGGERTDDVVIAHLVGELHDGVTDEAEDHQ